MRQKVFIGLLMVIAAVFIAMRLHEGEVLRLSDRSNISFEQMMQELMKADVILVGEVHNEPAHHAVELEIIKNLFRKGDPISIGLEMFRGDSQKDLDAWVAGKKSIEDFRKIYFDNWNQAWSSYRAILLYARDNRIPLIGLNLPDAIAVKVAMRGFDSLSAEDRELLPSGVSCNVDSTYMAFIRQAYAGHANGAGKRFKNFCEAQMVWDKTMALRLLEYRRIHPQRQIIVLAGVGHAWKRGIAAQLSTDASLSYKVVLPLIPGMSEPDEVSLKDADYVVLR